MPAYGRDGWYEDVDILGDFAQDLSERLAELDFDFYAFMGDAFGNMYKVYPRASACLLVAPAFCLEAPAVRSGFPRRNASGRETPIQPSWISKVQRNRAQ